MALLKTLLRIENLNVSIILVLLFVTASCAKNIDPILKKSKVSSGGTQFGVATMAGDFQLEDGSKRSLASFIDKPLLLFFVSETCSVCREETEHLLEDLKANGLPTNINIVSVLVGSAPEDIEYWKSSFSQVPSWPIGADDFNLKLYFQYFSSLVTPSTLYYNPSTQTLRRWQEAVPIKTLKEITGPWLY